MTAEKNIIRTGSVCSGILAPEQAWAGLGFEPQWFSEIDPHCNSLIKHYFPDVPNLGDMKYLLQNPISHDRPIDLLVGGTPCQSFSIAGLRKGLADPRGNLALHFLAIVNQTRPRWVVWENVPGVLSSWSDQEEDTERPGEFWQTNDFDTFCRGLTELGFGIAYRVLDAQYFGVAQRRRRVFVVGYIGNWQRAAAVLFNAESMCGYPAPVRKQGKNVAGTIDASAGRSRGAGINPDLIVGNFTTKPYSDDGIAISKLVMTTGQANAEIMEEKCPTLNCNHEAPRPGPPEPARADLPDHEFDPTPSPSEFPWAELIEFGVEKIMTSI